MDEAVIEPPLIVEIQMRRFLIAQTPQLVRLGLNRGGGCLQREAGLPRVLFRGAESIAGGLNARRQ